uniref:XPA_C domain-containing protein n=1 Tax=Rhabditophanes sp. KR3021 TaxID=114890 RepID=A0AC35TZA3_9BILA
MSKRKQISSVEASYVRKQDDYEGAGGFDLREVTAIAERDQYRKSKRARVRDGNKKASLGELMPENCDRCNNKMEESTLWSDYGFGICDGCREEHRGDYKLITKTDAKLVYLLKDEDLEYRQPALRYLLKKNPHNPRYGDMALYLEKQVEERSLSIYGDQGGLDLARKIADEKRSTRLVNKYKKQMNEIKRDIRAKEKFSKDYNLISHECTYQPEIYDEAKDEYSKRCDECQEVIKYQKI